jgi:hypothetical protein
MAIFDILQQLRSEDLLTAAIPDETLFENTTWQVQEDSIVEPTVNPDIKEQYYPNTDAKLKFIRVNNSLKIKIQGNTGNKDVEKLEFEIYSDRLCISKTPRSIGPDELGLTLMVICTVTGDDDDKRMQAVPVFRDAPNDFSCGSWFCKD